MVGAEGIEPSTDGLKGRYSTTELRPQTSQTLIFYYKNRSNHTYGIIFTMNFVPGIKFNILLINGITYAYLMRL